jgi:MFS transporter, DHA1 family, multidrug resistance protein
LEDIYLLPFFSPFGYFSMSELLRESAAGQLIRYLTKGKTFKYAEEIEGFQCPRSYTRFDPPEKAPHQGSTSPISDAQRGPSINEILDDVLGPELENASPSRPGTLETARSSSSSDGSEASRNKTRSSEALSRITSRFDSQNVTSRRDLERAYTEAAMRSQVEAAAPQAIIPEKAADGTILVDWYDTNDQENPQNWSFRKKCAVALQI